MKKEVFFPYGLSNFAEVATQDYVYVDKTPYIELLEKSKEKRVVFLRPRRFGKSLFVSLLEHYYDINRKEQFAELFSKYYIGKNPTPLANNFRILFFNFSGIDTSTQESSRQGFNVSVRASIESFFLEYPILTMRKKASSGKLPMQKNCSQIFFLATKLKKCQSTCSSTNMTTLPTKYSSGI